MNTIAPPYLKTRSAILSFSIRSSSANLSLSSSYLAKSKVSFSNYLLLISSSLILSASSLASSFNLASKAAYSIY